MTCVRYSVVRPAPRRSRALRHDGRCSRILRALAEGPMTQGRIYALTDPGKYPRTRETLKIFSALRDMRGLGWVDHHRTRGWFRTELGALALEHAEREAAGAASPFPPRSQRSIAHD